MLSVKNPFYTAGLKFSCKRCSSCCRYTPGYVFLSYTDLDNLCKATSLDRITLIKQYCRIVDISGFQRLSLVETPDYDCIFWNSRGCLVYNHRPLQCRSFPFWSSNIDSLNTWNELSLTCPGINTGKLIKKKEIDAWLHKKIKDRYIKISNGKIVL